MSILSFNKKFGYDQRPLFADVKTYLEIVTGFSDPR